jgi:hypothetical protein
MLPTPSKSARRKAPASPGRPRGKAKPSKAAPKEELQRALTLLTAERDGTLQQLNHLREERDAALREKEAAVAEVARLEAAHEEQLALVDAERVRITEAHIRLLAREGGQKPVHPSEEAETSTEDLMRAKEKAVASLAAARDAQRKAESVFGEMAPLFSQVTQLQKTLRSISAGDPEEADVLTELHAALRTLRAQWNTAKAHFIRVSNLEPFELSPDENLLVRSKYKIESEIARNGSFVDYRAWDLNLQREVALRIVRPDANARHEIVSGWVAQMRRIGGLEHPNVQPIYDAGVDEAGRAYCTAKLVHGRTLRKILHDLAAKKPSVISAFDLRRLLGVFIEACAAVAYAHESGVAHGNLGTEAIHLGAFGEVTVTGWEEARGIEEAPVGRLDDTILPDIHGLGQVLYHVLTLTEFAAEAGPLNKPAAHWLAPKGLWKLTHKLLKERVAGYRRVQQIQREAEQYRYELGARSGRSGVLERLKGQLEKWQ